MKKEINLIYKPVTDTDSEEARRVEGAFDVLFEEIWPPQAQVQALNVSTTPKEVSPWQIRR